MRAPPTKKNHYTSRNFSQEKIYLPFAERARLENFSSKRHYLIKINQGGKTE
jgi:hypothetical protein